MTAREKLNRQMPWLVVPGYTGGGLFVSGACLPAALGQPVAALVVVGLIGFAVAFALLMAAHLFAFRCPRCRGNIGPLIMQRGGLSVDQRLNFCPYCGSELDEELEELASSTDDSA
jgi:hypothetical protein